MTGPRRPSPPATKPTGLPKDPTTEPQRSNANGPPKAFEEKSTTIEIFLGILAAESEYGGIQGFGGITRWFKKPPILAGMFCVGNEEGRRGAEYGDVERSKQTSF